DVVRARPAAWFERRTRTADRRSARRSRRCLGRDLSARHSGTRRQRVRCGRRHSRRRTRRLGGAAVDRAARRTHARALDETRFLMPFQRPRGTQDLLPADAAVWRRITDAMRRGLASYGYGEIRTPLFEETELFVRGVGTGTDIVAKEMYTFADRKGRSLTLRPEGTAPVVRAYLENRLGAEPGVQRLYYLGPMYRYDRPQAGRYREFFQVGAEAIGSPLPGLDLRTL